MVEQNKVEEIKKLINSGFDLELISFELNVPIKEIEQYKQSLESSSEYNIKLSDSEITDYGYLKLKQMRKNFQTLYFRNNKSQSQLSKQLSEQDIELIEVSIITIKEKIEEMRNLSKEEKRKIANDVILEFNKLECYELSIEQTEKLIQLLDSVELKNLKIRSTDKIDLKLSSLKNKAFQKFFNAINTIQQQSEDIEELKLLDEKINSEVVGKNQLIANSLKCIISNKISTLQQKNAIEGIRSDVSLNIELIIKDLVNGKIDIQSANSIVEAEAKKRVQTSPKTKFALTEEQERNKVLIHIRTIIMEQADKYYIENPETTILNIQELCGGGLEQAIKTVVNNLILTKRFEEARDICNSFASKHKENINYKYIISLKNEIRNAEIGDMVLKGINMKGTVQEESEYFKLIEKGLEIGNVRPQAISLGRSEDGLKPITLADIWPKEKRNYKTR